MESVIQKVESKYKKKKVVSLRSGDTVRVHQKIIESGKERVQIFEGTIIKAVRQNSLSASFTVRRVASGVGVEKTFLMHSPGILRIEVTKRSKVRRNYLTYMRGLRGKSARLSGVDFDRDAVNATGEDQEAEAQEKDISQKQEESYDTKAAKAEKADEKQEAAEAKAETPKTEADKIEERPKERAEAKAPAEAQNKQK